MIGKLFHCNFRYAANILLKAIFAGVASALEPAASPDLPSASYRLHEATTINDDCRLPFCGPSCLRCALLHTAQHPLNPKRSGT